MSGTIAGIDTPVTINKHNYELILAQLQKRGINNQIAKIQQLANTETDPDVVKIYNNELSLHQWKSYPFQLKDNQDSLYLKFSFDLFKQMKLIMH